MLGAGALLVACPPAGTQPEPQTGEVMYSDCVSCHGENGQGMAQFLAPAIAGLPTWYLEAQLQKFRTGLRGSHVDDAEGLRMRPMSWQIRNDRDVKELSRYLGSLPAAKADKTLAKANVEAGKTAYQVCVACHMANGAGNQALNAPPLTGQHDWYLTKQLQKFKAGVRGTAPGDITGAQMRPMAMTLADDQAVANVVAYISTLSP
jgi:cytochrome c553